MEIDLKEGAKMRTGCMTNFRLKYFLKVLLIVVLAAVLLIPGTVQAAEQKAVQAAEQKAVQAAEQKAVQAAEQKAVQAAEQKAVQAAEQKNVQAAEQKAVQAAEQQTAHSDEQIKTVRVGWYDSVFNSIDSFGRRSGYAYEYQMKIASWAGWEYEYVKGSWSDLMQMLENGEIDLMSDVSYTAERSEKMLFPSQSMGSEEYYIFVSPENSEITEEDPTTLNGKRIGVNKGSIQKEFYLDWAEKNGVQTRPEELTCTEEESVNMLEQGTLDAFITLDAFEDPERTRPLFRIGSSDFYFVVNKDRPDLLEDLNYALDKIQDENSLYHLQLTEKYLKNSGSNAFLSQGEEHWLADHGTIRVGYQDNYLAFCAKDPETGELTGAMKDYLESISTCFANAALEFEAVAYPTASDALDAVQEGEVDCMFPANLSSYDGEILNVNMTPSLIRTDIYAVVRMADEDVFREKEHVIVAVNEGNPNYDTFLLDHFPEWRAIYYPQTADCLEAVADGVADCVLISSYRYNNIARICERYRLGTLSTGISMDYSFAVRDGETQLYSILTKAEERIPESTVNAALSYYVAQDSRQSIGDFLLDHITAVLAVIIIIVLAILFFLFRSIRSEKKAARLIAATETDELTGLYTRNFFFQYANSMRREHPDEAMDAIVLNIEQFHLVNAMNGRAFGDDVLRVLGNEIYNVSKEYGGIAGRFQADRFDIYCRPPGDYQIIYERLQNCLNELTPNATIRLRMGVMSWQDSLEPEQQFDRARTACSMARGHYKEHLVIFDEKVREREIYEHRLLNDLRRALESHEFEVYYQPKYDIRCEPPKLASAEALIRWKHPELGMIPPGDFIPLFEKNGNIGDVDKYVWTEAARQIRKWRDSTGVSLPVSVNLSRVDVFDPKLEETLDGILERFGLEHDVFRLEVTESAYTENADQVIQVVESLRQKGYTVEMDDFGTGYSSLNMLSAMPIDVLKMDQTFIRNMEHDEKDIQLVALILDIARNLEIPVVAEGVENESQIRLLKELGCALVQGYYFSKPLPADDFAEKFLNTSSDADGT